MASKSHLRKINALLLVTSAHSNDHWVTNLTQHILIPYSFYLHSFTPPSLLTWLSRSLLHFSSSLPTPPYPRTQLRLILLWENKRRGLDVLIQFPFHIPHNHKAIFIIRKCIYSYLMIYLKWFILRPSGHRRNRLYTLFFQFHSILYLFYFSFIPSPKLNL